MHLGRNGTTLSLCMIVRDNEDTIGPCLESVKPWVDEMVIVDTGSKDKTPEIAKSFGARLSYFDWIDDFSAARNESISKAKGDWIFWMDSDDTIPPECGKHLRALANSPHDTNVMGYVMQVRCPANGSAINGEYTVVDHVKMFRNHAELRFEGRIHEQVLMPIRRLGGEVSWTDIFVVHSGSQNTEEARKRKTDRDLRILKLDLEERPNHPFVLFNFAMTYAEMGEFEEALPWIERCLAASKPHESHLAKTHSYKANCLFQLGRYKESLEVCQAARSVFPLDAELLFREAMALHELKSLHDAILRYQELLNLPKHDAFRSTDPGIEGYKCRFNLGVAFRDAGELDDAELQWRLVLEQYSDYVPAAQALCDLLVEQERFVTATIVAEQLSLQPNSGPAGLLQLSRIIEIQHGADSAFQFLTQHLNEFEVLIEEYCRHLFAREEWEKCLSILHSLLAISPDNASALHNIGAAYLQVGDKEQAHEALSQSLRIRPNSTSTQELMSIVNQT